MSTDAAGSDAKARTFSMWRIITLQTIRGETIPHGIRDDGGFLCFFAEPNFYHGQSDRYAEECAALRRHATVMLAALNKTGLALAAANTKSTRQRIKQLQNGAAGLCQRCSEPAVPVGSRVCARHRDIERASYPAKIGRPYKCTYCDAPGHNRQTCPRLSRQT